MFLKPGLVASAAVLVLGFFLPVGVCGSAEAGEAARAPDGKAAVHPRNGEDAGTARTGAAGRGPQEASSPIYFYPSQVPSTAPEGYSYTVPLGGGAVAPGGTMTLRSRPYARSYIYIYPYPDPSAEPAYGEGRGGYILVQEREPRAPVAPAVPEERPKAEKPREELLLESGAVLLRRGNLQIEPSIDFAHFSGDRVAISGVTIFEAIVIGTIRVDRLDRNFLTPALTTRYGITNRLQVDTRIPGVYREDNEVEGVGTADAVERTTDNTALGDIEAGVSYQAFLQRGAIPGVILRLRGTFPTGEHPFEIPTVLTGPGERRLVRPPTGSGFYSVESGTTLVWRVDPVVFFGGLSYELNLSREFAGAGNVDPGETIEFFAGLNLALSERVAINMSIIDQATSSTEQNDTETPGTSFNDGRLSLGTSIGFGPTTSLLVSATAGLTEQSPDFQFTVSLPMTFSLF